MTQLPKPAKKQEIWMEALGEIIFPKGPLEEYTQRK